ncbi:hypothetical protein W97_06346 [Coniosporium apollinis CBS 100218]|uniref:Sulfite efflux pump SSU1 n=1 Tax=Coniosporium apollinis (strain CBS 100218) TaxID=1168221 RepID=R7YZ42_CONA1|nr:uncharacterized protein W97_06346 [Coniosporium apollinis CBS 100218]EON67093.1 hypothetical protein W97_06346 [Coniosporium apollinis CBS 100218]
MLGPTSILSGRHWQERILNFTPAWFMVAMGTGAIQQALVNFPYPITGASYWMRNLGYCFWILDILLFCFFTVMLAVRYITHPTLINKNITEFPSSSYFGAIPIALDTIIIGIVSYYNYRPSAMWVAFGLWWVALALTLLVSIGLLIVQVSGQPQHSITDVAGLWLMTCVPMLVTAATGSTIIQYLGTISTKCSITILIISFLLWSLGTTQIHLIIAVYFWRLVSSKLPPNQLLASGFLPLAPLGQGAYGIQQLSIYLANYLRTQHYAPTQSSPPPLPQGTLDSTAEVIHWLGILLSLFFLAHATFWLVQASSAMISRKPKSFNIGMWGLTFPIASYANAWSYLSRDLRNDGMRGWAATTTVAVVVIWLVLALITTWLGLFKGELFNEPGLEEWIPQEKRDEETETGQSSGQSSSSEQDGSANRRQGREADQA